MRKLIVAAGLALLAWGLVPAAPAQAADPGAEAQFVTAINALRAGVGSPPLAVHAVLVAKAEAWAAHMAATGVLEHSYLPDGITVGWRRLAENVGVGPNIDAVHQSFAASPAHYSAMVDPGLPYVGVGVAYGGGRVWVAEEFMDGDAPAAPAVDWSFVWRDYRGRSVAPNPHGGYYVLNGNGSVSAFGGAPYFGAPSFGWDIARDIAVMPDGNGYLILDGYGGVHKFGSAAQGTIGSLGGPYFGFDIARGLALAPNGNGYGVLDGWGGLHGVGSAPWPPGLPYWPGWDIARAVAYTPQGGVYVLDGWGGVHAAGGAPFYGAAYWPGWDIARDISAGPDGAGYAVLDGWGGIHPFGSAPSPKPIDWAPVDRWRGIVVTWGGYWVVRNDGTVEIG